MKTHQAWFDGSAIPNPGIMTIGGYINDDIGKPVYEFSSQLGQGTNNQAEYLALIKVLEKIKNNKIENVEIRGDSALVVNQVNLKWKAKNPNMKRLRNMALELLEGINWKLSHVPRSENAKADLLTH